MHSLEQLPLLAAARVIDKVPGQNLFQLPHREVFYRLFIVQIRQRGPDPPLRRRTDLQIHTVASQWPVSRLFSARCSSISRKCANRTIQYLDHVFCGLQVQEGRCWSVLMLLLAQKQTESFQ